MVTAFKNRPFVPADNSESKSNVQLFEEVVKDSIKSFTEKLDSWFKDRYNFNLYKEESSYASIPVSMPQRFDEAKILLMETNERAFKFNEPETYKKLEQELNAIKDDYTKIKNDHINPNMNNANVNVAQQSVPVDSASVKRNEILSRLEEYEKKLRKIIFDKMPKTAN
jgi:hypothetical protein